MCVCVCVYVQVHRQLLAVIGSEERERERLPGNTQLAQLCRHMNSKHRVSGREMNRPR